MDESKIFSLVAEALGVDVSVVNKDTLQTDLPEWDSLGHLAVLQALDSTLEGGVGELDGIGTVKSIAALLSILRDAGRVN
jgi:acyl carrier protein